MCLVGCKELQELRSFIEFDEWFLGRGPKISNFINVGWSYEYYYRTINVQFVQLNWARGYFFKKSKHYSMIQHFSRLTLIVKWSCRLLSVVRFEQSTIFCFSIMSAQVHYQITPSFDSLFPFMLNAFPNIFSTLFFITLEVWVVLVLHMMIYL
jgi:hypothetical protein